MAAGGATVSAAAVAAALAGRNSCQKKTPGRARQFRWDSSRYVEGRSVGSRVEPFSRRAALSHERENDQHLLLDVPRVGPFGRPDAAEDALELDEMRVGGVRRPSGLLSPQEIFGRPLVAACIQRRSGTQQHVHNRQCVAGWKAPLAWNKMPARFCLHIAPGLSANVRTRVDKERDHLQWRGPAHAHISGVVPFQLELMLGFAPRAIRSRASWTQYSGAGPLF